jgi:hypothetical protein
MEPAIGRFLGMDVWLGRNFSPITQNKYIYANARPSELIDPTGYFGMLETSIANNIRTTISQFQINLGNDMMDAAIAGEYSPFNSQFAGIGVLSALGGAAADRLLSMLSKSCRKAGGKGCAPVLGGRYKDIDTWRKKFNKGGEIHHMPSWHAIKGKMSFGNGPGIWMVIPDHKKTISHGNSGNLGIKHRERQKEWVDKGRWCEAIALDVDDIRDKFPGKYELGILQFTMKLPGILGAGCFFLP